MRTIVLAAMCIVIIGAPDGRAGVGSVTWIGTVGRPPSMQPSPWDAAHRPNAHLVVSGSAALAEFEGLTGATHDAPDLRTSCTIHYRLVRKSGAWSYYQQVGPSRYAHPGRGYVANAPCEMSGGGALKTTLSGSKLRADFGLVGDGITYWRGYLRHL
jgi:hypothetical protein